MAVQPREHPSCGLVGLPELAGPSSHPGGRRWTVGSQTGQPEACDHGGRHLGPAPQAGHWAAPAAPDIHMGETSAAPPPAPQFHPDSSGARPHVRPPLLAGSGCSDAPSTGCDPSQAEGSGDFSRDPGCRPEVARAPHSEGDLPARAPPAGAYEARALERGRDPRERGRDPRDIAGAGTCQAQPLS